MRLLLLSAVAFVFTAQVHAVCFEPKIRVDDEFFTSQIVFTGTIIADRKVGVTVQGDFDGHVFRWRVERVLRGKIHVGDVVRTYSEDSSGRFPIEAEEGHQVGRRFLIFASPDSTRVGEYSVDDCGNSVPLSQGTRTIAEIQTLPGRHGGLLYGEMFDGDEGVRVIATAGGKKYETVSGAEGKFSLRVPPGTYSVTAAKSGHTYTDFELAYKRSKNVVIPDGGSAGLAFCEVGR